MGSVIKEIAKKYKPLINNGLKIKMASRRVRDTNFLDGSDLTSVAVWPSRVFQNYPVG
jgi:hypothetical protein